MSFLDTVPAVIDRLNFAGSWGRFRVTDPRLRLATLRQLCRGDAPVSLGAPAERLVTGALWAIDDVQGRLHFNLPPDTCGLDRLSGAEPVWAAAYLSDAKVQFLLRRPQADASPNQLALYSEAPLEMYHLPRRRSVRVHRPHAHAPWLHFAHPLATDQHLSLRALDVSESGCALFKPLGSLPLAPGSVLRRVDVALEDDVRFVADLRVQHVTPIAGARLVGARVGCAWLGLCESAQEALQRWIRGGYRRRDLVSLHFG